MEPTPAVPPGARLLIIEDDKRLLRALSYFLRQKGLEVHEATDGEQGLDAWESLAPDVLVVDNSLPTRMGYEVCREIRGRGGRGASTPIVMISAFMKVLGVDNAHPTGNTSAAERLATAADAAASSAAEDDELVDAFLRKPFQLEQLWSVITSLVVDGRFVRPGRAGVDSGPTPALTAEGLDDAELALPAEGSCEKIPFIELLARALRHQTTGILTLRESNRVRRLYLANGFPAFARSNLITENLLRYLLRVGEIDAETYRRHLSRMQQERWRPGATLVREGAISLTRLNRSHRLLVEEIIEICFNWTSARFEFKPSQVPVEQAVVYDINPFRLVDRWLEQNFTASQLLDRVQHLVHARIEPSARLDGWRHLLDWAYLLDPELEEAIATPRTLVELLDAVGSEQRPLRARLLQTQLLLGATSATDPEGRLARQPAQLIRRLMRPPTTEELADASGAQLSFSSPRMPAIRPAQSSLGIRAGQSGLGDSALNGSSSLGGARPGDTTTEEARNNETLPGPAALSSGTAQPRVEPPPAPATVERSTSVRSNDSSSILLENVAPPPDGGTDGRTQEQLRRIYDVVLRDYRRVLDGASPFDVLRVSRNDALDVIRRRYERFERFYRPENFQRLGDSKLFRLAIEIRQALARAMADIEAGLSSQPGLQALNPDASFGRSLSWLDPAETSDPLGQIFFNDGLTFLRLGDFDEAHAHFSRALSRERGNGMFEAYLIWASFLRAGRSAEAAVTARAELESLIERCPDQDAVYHFLAHIYREEGNLELAVSFYRKAAELNPDNRSARLFLQRLQS